MSNIPLVTQHDCRSVYPTIYVALANLITEDPFISELQATGEFVYDFLPYKGIKAEYSQPPISTTPQDKPRLYLVRTSTTIKGLNSAQKSWTVGYNVVVQGLHIRSEIVDQLTGQLDSVFSDTTFVRAICGQITSSASQFNFDVAKKTVTTTLSLSIVVTTAR